MSLDSVEQELFDFAWQSMPQWYRDLDRTKEELYGFAKVFGAVKKVLTYWFQMSYITTATGRELGDAGWLNAHSETTYGPDWLDFHASDRGTRRANGETDTVMRTRLLMPPKEVTRTKLLEVVQEILDVADVDGDVGMVELPRDAGYLGKLTLNMGTGGTFTKVGSTMTFEPSTPYAYVPYSADISGMVQAHQLALSGSSSAGNDGTFTITGVAAANDGDGQPSLTGATYANADGVAEADAGCTWVTWRLDRKNAPIDGKARCYVNRGYRVWRGQNVAGQKKSMGGFIVILPYGTPDGVMGSMREALRQKKAAGIIAIVERANWT